MCGSPTVIWNEGFAACSTLTLGCVCRWGALLLAGWTGGGTLGPDDTGVSSSSSSRLTESIMPRRDDVEAAAAAAATLRGLRDAVGSFCGGAGGASGADGGVAAPKGPRGSSTASRRVAWPPYCFRRGPRPPAGERGAADTLGTELSVALGVDSGLYQSTSIRLLRARCAYRSRLHALSWVRLPDSMLRVHLSRVR